MSDFTAKMQQIVCRVHCRLSSKQTHRTDWHSSEIHKVDPTLPDFANCLLLSTQRRADTRKSQLDDRRTIVYQQFKLPAGGLFTLLAFHTNASCLRKPSSGCTMFAQSESIILTSSTKHSATTSNTFILLFCTGLTTL